MGPELKPGEYLVARSELAEPVPCRACSAPVAWVLTKGGKRAPLSLGTARMVPCPDCGGLLPLGAGQPRPLCPLCTSTGQLYIVLTHFADCPEANQFRKTRKA